MQDKAGNLWFGTTQNGLYKYDGKSFNQFLVADGLNSNNIWSLLEDKTGKLWVGTRATGLYLYDGKKFIVYSEYKHWPVTVHIPASYSTDGILPGSSSKLPLSSFPTSLLQKKQNLP